MTSHKLTDAARISQVAAGLVGRKAGKALTAAFGLRPADQEFRSKCEAVQRVRRVIEAKRAGRREGRTAVDPLAVGTGRILRLAEARQLAGEKSEHHARTIAPLEANLNDWLSRPCRPVLAKTHAMTIAKGGWGPDELVDATASLAVEVLAHALGVSWKRHGWKPVHRSRINGGTSRYLRHHDGRTLRISDHRVPWTDARQYRADNGRGGPDCELLLNGRESWREALRELGEVLRD